MNVVRFWRGCRKFALPPRLHKMSCRTISRTMLLEEETMSHYDSKLFYPVHIDQVFQDRYKILVKLGYGGSSTVWLCKDKKEKSYKTIKVGTYRVGESDAPEIRVLEHLKSLKSTNVGQMCVRKACDHFRLQVSGGHHPCLVYEPLGMNLLEYADLQPTKTVHLHLTKFFTLYVLYALDYLHTSGVIHTDLKLDNLQLTMADDYEDILKRMVDAERSEPGPRKVVDEQLTIYTSRKPEYTEGLACPILSDIGTGVFGEAQYDALIQPIPYRAPEVILRMKWDQSVDIWNLGVLVWELLCGERLFGNVSEEYSMAKMVTYLGAPPPQFVRQSVVCSEYFDEKGVWKGSPLEPEPLQERLEGPMDVDKFVDFMKSMLAWEPEKRLTTAALLEHPWLTAEPEG